VRGKGYVWLLNDFPTNYAVAARYPGLAEPVTWEEYKMAVALAEEVVRWVEKALGGL
jgi:HEPN domain-containing protein